MVVMVQGKQQKCGGGGGCEEKQSKCGGSGGGGGGKTIEMWCWRENNRNVEVMVVMKGKQYNTIVFTRMYIFPSRFCKNNKSDWERYISL